LRTIWIAAALAGALAASAHAEETGFFQKDHGKIVAAPQGVSAAKPAPPEGLAAGGLDFGPWRGDDPNYEGRFQSRVRQHLTGKRAVAARADLESNGFTCAEGGRAALECRLPTTDKGCDVEWWVVLELVDSQPLAGRDRMCLGR
jgi:hypothetical protein